MKKLLSVLLIIFCSASSIAQVASITSGNWNSTATWDCTCVPDFSQGQITISALTTVTVPNGFTADVDQVLVDGDGALTIQNGGTLIARDGSGDDLVIAEADFIFTFANGNLTVNNGGILENRGQMTAPASNSTFQTGSIFRHNQNNGSIPTLTWNSGSTCEVTGVTTTPPSGLSQSFSNFEWNSAQTSTVFLNGNLTSIGGDFIVRNTGAGSTFLTLSSQSGGETRTINVGGDIQTLNATKLYFTTTGNYTVDVIGDVSIGSTAGTYALLFTASGSALLNVGGNFSNSVAGGTINLSAAAGSGNMNVKGNFSLAAGATITESAAGSGGITFSGTGIQTFSNLGTISNTVNYAINNGSSVDLGTSVLAGLGSFTLQGGGTVFIGSPDGLAVGTTLGNIRVAGTRTYQANGNIVYSGVTQNLGNEWVTGGALNGIAVNLELINGTVLSNNNIAGTSLVGVLTLTNGRLNIGTSNSLIIQGIFNSTVSGTIGGSPSGNLTFDGSGAMGSLNMASGAEALNNLSILRSGTLTLGSNLTVAGVIALTSGNLDFSGRTLTMNGSAVTTGGSTGLISNSSSNLVLGGSTYSGSIPFSGSTNQLNDLTFQTSGAGAYTWTSNVTINGDVTLTSGALTHTSGLTMGTNSTFFKGAGTISGASPNAVTSYNVTYTGIGNTGVELPSLATALNDLTVTSSGTITLVTTGITINGNALFSSGNFAAGSNTLVMEGPTWSTSGGSFTPGTGTVVIQGATSIQGTGTPQFYNLTVATSGANCTARAGVIDILNNLQVDAASTFNHNNGTFNFTSGALQGIGGGGKNFFNITVNKTGGNLQLTSALNLVNALTVISPTTVESDGNLVLISTSDGITGNASIGPLEGGANITGDVTAQRFMSEEGRIYRYISSPVTNASVAQLQDDFFITGTFSGADTGCTGCTTNASMFYYDESIAGTLQDGYFQYPVATNTETLEPGRGYVPFVRDDIIAGNVTIDVTGPLNQGTVIFPITYNGSGDGAANGYNLVGNPYPSSIDWDNLSGWNKIAMSGSIQVRDNGGGGVFHAWDGAVGSFNNGQIAAGQGFWVRATGASSSLEANELAKTSATGTFYRNAEEEEELHYLEILLTDGTLTDRAYLRLRTKAANILDEFDAPKLDNESFDMYTVSEDNLPMVINAMKTVGCDQPIKIGIKDMPNGNFNFTRKAIGDFEQYTIVLHDKFTNSTVTLGTADKYEFVVSADAATKAEDRFSVTLSITVPADVEYVDNILHSNYPSGNQWYRNGIAIEGATESTLTPDLSGEYSLIVTVGTCESAAARTFQITGVEEDEQSYLRIYPNPAVEVIQVEVRSAFKVAVDLLDVMGRHIEEIPVSERGDGVWTGTTNLAHFEKGVYIVRVFDAANGSTYRRIIKE